MSITGPVGDTFLEVLATCLSGQERDNLDMDQVGMCAVEPLSIAVEPFNAVLIHSANFIPYYEFATVEWLNLQTGDEVEDQILRLRGYGQFRPGHSLVGGRPWRPMLPDVANIVEEHLALSIETDGEGFAQIAYEEDDTSFSLYAVHSVLWGDKVEVVVSWRTMDMLREWPYQAYIWSLWLQALCVRTGRQPWRVRHMINIPYVKTTDVRVVLDLDDVSSGYAPPITDAIDWQEFLEVERHLRVHGNDEVSVLPASIQPYAQLLRHRFKKDPDLLDPVWIPLCPPF